MLNKLKTFLRTGVAQSEPVSQFKWRTLPSLARGTGGTIEQVLEAIKEDPRSFVIRFGRRGDIYVAQAGSVDGGYAAGDQ